MLCDLAGIKKVLPHREPFLLIDAIEKMDENSVTGLKRVTSEDFWVPGHFPQEAVMPGVLICEALAQTGAYYVLSKPENRGKIAYFGRMDKVRFKHKVVPGDTLRLEVEIGRLRGPVGFGTGKAYVGDTLCCQMEMTFALGDAE